jgi:glyceraldehyde-3-phosphate dehydrogenase (NADP+)
MTAEEHFSPLYAEHSQIPSQFQLTLIEQRTYLINGELRRWDGEMQEVYSPVCTRTSNGVQQEILGSFPLLGPQQATEILDVAVGAYQRGQGEWPTMSVSKRIECVMDFLNRMIEQRAAVVKLLMWEIGKTLSDSEKEFDRTIDYIRDTIEALKDLDRASSRFQIEQGIIAQIRRMPLGVVLCMGPFNYPLNETFTTLIPALIMGNVVLFKPAKHGVLLHSPLLEAFQKSFPKGVVNTLYGRGHQLIPPLMETGKIDVLGLIGSSKVASALKKAHPKPHRLRAVLSLDAKNSGIILKDATIDDTVKECVLGALSFNGQRCTALKILFVHKAIAETFVKKISDAVNRLKSGMPWEEGTNLTPLPEPNKPKYLSELLSDAIGLGAKVQNENGGLTFKTFFHPAVVYPITKDMRLYREEQFGPIIPIVSFEDIEEVIEYITNSNYGQQVSIFGNDADELARLIDALTHQVCRININAQSQRGPDKFPFAGRKDSAETTLSVSDALRAFSIRSMVATKSTIQNKALITEITREHKSGFLSTDFIL